ncbi:MAG: DUF2812 domain-containing protein [Oscillospiraceae bacterium]|nr:DUF2812 domain-containing protein [Oscillospiraceae bacterium]
MSRSPTKTVVRIYAPWSFQKELDDLDAASREGWQLVKGGRLVRRFRREEGVYRFALDYDFDLQDHNRYYATFREQGWELVNNTWNGWHYFRKRYDPALPESDYEIFTDAASRREMAERLAKRYRGSMFSELLCAAMCLAGIMLFRNNIALIAILMAAFLTEALISLLCSRRMRRAGDNERGEHDEK